MNRRTLLILVTATLAMVALLYVGPRQLDDAESELLLPDLKARLNDISKVTVVAAGDSTVATLVRGDEQWTVAEKSGYPADLAKLRRTLISLADATIVERKTADASLHSRLGVEDVSQAGAAGFQLNIYGAGPDGGQPVSVIVGNTGVRGNMAYVRRTGEGESLLIAADLDIGGSVLDWIARDLINISSGDIRVITITQPGGDSLIIERQQGKDSELTVVNIPEGRALSYASIANPIAGVLSSLQFDDVMPAGALEPDGLVPVVSRFETFEGLIVEARAYAADDDLWIGFSASADEALAAQAEDLNSRLGPWLFSIPSYKSEQLVKPMNDLLESGDE